MKHYQTALVLVTSLALALSAGVTPLAAYQNKVCNPGFWVIVPPACGICCYWEDEICKNHDCTGMYSTWLGGFCVTEEGSTCTQNHHASQKPIVASGCGTVNPGCGCDWTVTDLRNVQVGDCS